MAIFYGVFQKRLYQNQGPEKKEVSDNFFLIFLQHPYDSTGADNKSTCMYVVCCMYVCMVCEF